MENTFDFTDLIVLDIANNHQGSIDHGRSIIREMGAIAHKHAQRTAIKFQFRHLDSFIHPDHKAKSDVKHITRFQGTRLAWADYQKLFDTAREMGLLTMCTPFDEESVEVICEMGFDLMKVASCSATDWPLLEKISGSGLPIICSTGGLMLHEIDNVVSFFRHRGVQFALMHCVSIYPTPPEQLSLNMIDIMRARYPELTIGWSTHEDQDDTVPIGVAFAKGAQMFERHVGIKTDTIELNAYSSTPDQVDRWVMAYHHARTICGAPSPRSITEPERLAMDGLRRGIYARRPLKKGQVVSREDIYFAMPYQSGQIPSGSWRGDIIVEATIKQDGAITTENVYVPEEPDVLVVKRAVHEVKALLNEARVALGPDFKTEYSHHYGLRHFREYGAVLIDCINRDYCKKIIVQLAGQRHPSHYHKRKEETFQILHGSLTVIMDGHKRTLFAGDTCLVMPGVWHSFSTDEGCVFEEISTTHYDDDSFYADQSINHLERGERKTVVDHWGRFQILDKAVPEKRS